MIFAMLYYLYQDNFRNEQVDETKRMKISFQAKFVYIFFSIFIGLHG